VSEDGVLTDWFRAPHKRYGTSFRMINLIVILQLLTIIGSRGNVYVLGEAYAFGVIWSFAFKALAVLVLRFRDKSPREWKVPLNLKLDGYEIPLGLGIIAALLFSVAGINLITKQVATISGVAFTLIFFTLFSVSERINERKRGNTTNVELDQFRLQMQELVTNETVEVRPGCTLCLVRDYNTLDHVRNALELTHTGKCDLVMMTVQLMTGPDTGYENLREENLFTGYEQLLFSRVVALAEKAGKHVDLLVVPSSNIFEAIAHTAAQLEASMIIAGRSSVISPEEQAKRLGEAWEAMEPKPKHQVCFCVAGPNRKTQSFYLGAHLPQLAEEDIRIIHKLWLDITAEPFGAHADHKEVVTIALSRLEAALKGKDRPRVLEQVNSLILQRNRPERAEDNEENAPTDRRNQTAADDRFLSSTNFR
jgi:hypothetical protein